MLSPLRLGIYHRWPRSKRPFEMPSKEQAFTRQPQSSATLLATRDDGPTFSDDRKHPISPNRMIGALYRLGYRGRPTIRGFRVFASTRANDGVDRNRRSAESLTALPLRRDRNAVCLVKGNGVRRAYSAALTSSVAGACSKTGLTRQIFGKRERLEILDRDVTRKLLFRPWTFVCVRISASASEPSIRPVSNDSLSRPRVDPATILRREIEEQSNRLVLNLESERQTAKVYKYYK